MANDASPSPKALFKHWVAARLNGDTSLRPRSVGLSLNVAFALSHGAVPRAFFVRRYVTVRRTCAYRLEIAQPSTEVQFDPALVGPLVHHLRDELRLVEFQRTKVR